MPLRHACGISGVQEDRSRGKLSHDMAKMNWGNFSQQLGEFPVHSSNFSSANDITTCCLEGVPCMVQ